MAVLGACSGAPSQREAVTMVGTGPAGEPAPAPAPAPEPRADQEPEPQPEALTVALMREVKRDLKRGDAAALRGHVADEATLIIDICNDNCESGCNVEEPPSETVLDACTRRTEVRGYAAFASWLAGARPGWAPANCREDAPPARAEQCRYYAGFYIRGRMVCNQRCCRLTSGYSGHEMLALESICFEPTDSGALRIASIRMLEF